MAEQNQENTKQTTLAEEFVAVGLCRYCGRPRPAGYSVTCGNSFCQEAAYHDKEDRTPRKRGR